MYGAITGAVAYGGYKLGEMLNESSMWKNTDVYAPDRPLPTTQHGVHVPDTDAPHTQLGTQESKEEKENTPKLESSMRMENPFGI